MSISIGGSAQDLRMMTIGLLSIGASHIQSAMVHLSESRAYLKTGNVPNRERLFRWASHFFQEYWLYFKEKWCGTAEKYPLFGRVDRFQIGPR